MPSTSSSLVSINVYLGSTTPLSTNTVAVIHNIVKTVSVMAHVIPSCVLG